jgi:hypothetical protein
MFGRMEQRQVRRRAALSLVAVAVAVFSGPAAAPAAADVADLCAQQLDVNWAVPMPPPGYVTEVDWIAGQNCGVTQSVSTSSQLATAVSAYMTVNPSLSTTDPVPNPEGVTAFSSLTGPDTPLPVCDPDTQTLIECTSVIHASLDSSPPATQTLHASVHQRSWDCCNIPMNEYDLQWWWTYDYRIRGYNGHDYGQWHRESNGGGWYVAGGTEHLGASATYSSATLTGSIGYGYQGGFDPSGQAYYNAYSNSITGHTNGSWSCSGSWSWRRHAPGWHIQTWCGWGDSW